MRARESTNAAFSYVRVADRCGAGGRPPYGRFWSSCGDGGTDFEEAWIPLDLSIGGGEKGWVSGSPRTKGCIRACCGDQRRAGSRCRSPCTKSIKATRLFISVGELVSNGQMDAEKRTNLSRSQLPSILCAISGTA